MYTITITPANKMVKPTVYHVSTRLGFYYIAIKIAIALASTYYKIHGRFKADPVDEEVFHCLDKEDNIYLSIEVTETPIKSDLAYA